MGAHQSQQEGGVPESADHTTTLTSAVSATAASSTADTIALAAAVSAPSAPAAAISGGWAGAAPVTAAAAPPPPRGSSSSSEQAGADEVTLIQPMEAVVQERVLSMHPKSRPASPTSAQSALIKTMSSPSPDSPRSLLPTGPSVKVVNMLSMSAPRLSSSEVDECLDISQQQERNSGMLSMPAVRQFVA